ncbi:MAG: hypothetical protein WB507_02660, partial [Solirubrobacterales bacterium]
ECGFSQSLVDDLKAYRLQIARAHLAVDFDVAFDLALYSLCADLFERFGYRSHSLDLRVIETPLRSSLNDLAGTAADRLLEAQGRVLELDWLKFTAGGRLRRAHCIADGGQAAAFCPMRGVNDEVLLQAARPDAGLELGVFSCRGRCLADIGRGRHELVERDVADGGRAGDHGVLLRRSDGAFSRPFDPSHRSTPSLPSPFRQRARHPSWNHSAGTLGQLPPGGKYCVSNRDRNDRDRRIKLSP